MAPKNASKHGGDKPPLQHIEQGHIVHAKPEIPEPHRWQRVTDNDISPQTAKVLAVIHRNQDKPPTQGELTLPPLSIPRPTVTLAIKRLLELNLIVRDRVKIKTTTAKGTFIKSAHALLIAPGQNKRVEQLLRDNLEA